MTGVLCSSRRLYKHLNFYKIAEGTENKPKPAFSAGSGMSDAVSDFWNHIQIGELCVVTLFVKYHCQGNFNSRPCPILTGNTLELDDN